MFGCSPLIWAHTLPKPLFDISRENVNAQNHTNPHLNASIEACLPKEVIGNTYQRPLGATTSFFMLDTLNRRRQKHSFQVKMGHQVTPKETNHPLHTSVQACLPKEVIGNTYQRPLGATTSFHVLAALNRRRQTLVRHVQMRIQKNQMTPKETNHPLHASVKASLPKEVIVNTYKHPLGATISLPVLATLNSSQYTHRQARGPTCEPCDKTERPTLMLPLRVVTKQRAFVAPTSIPLVQ